MQNTEPTANLQSQQRRREQCVRDARRLLQLLTGVPSDPAHPRRRQLTRLARAALDCFARLGGAASAAACAVCTHEPALLWTSDVRGGRHCDEHAARFHAVAQRPFACCEDTYDPDREYKWREPAEVGAQPQDSLQ